MLKKGTVIDIALPHALVKGTEGKVWSIAVNEAVLPDIQSRYDCNKSIIGR